ncbi:MAG: DUF2628 domain-containing protein [Ruminococcaceae bacterium]|nr:DUF2628 domain-containing protein [Oscillospiraceae bacterium]
MENLNNDYRSQLIAKNIEYYGPRFAKFDEEGKKTSWNWFAFLVPFCWFAYRKMYAECIAYYVITTGLHTAINEILASIGHFTDVGWTIDVVFMFLSGIYGNWLYKNKIDKNVERCIRLPEDKRGKYIKRWGGTSVLAIIIAFCITIGFAAVLYYTLGFTGAASAPVE